MSRLMSPLAHDGHCLTAIVVVDLPSLHFTLAGLAELHDFVPATFILRKRTWDDGVAAFKRAYDEHVTAAAATTGGTDEVVEEEDGPERLGPKASGVKESRTLLVS